MSRPRSALAPLPDFQDMGVLTDELKEYLYRQSLEFVDVRRRLDAAEVRLDVLEEMNFWPAYVYMSRDATAFPDLGLLWEPITDFDDAWVEYNISTDLVAGTMTFDYEGVYEIMMNVDIEHNSSNQGRTTYLRLYNTTDSTVVGSPLGIGIGRNVTDTFLEVSGIIPVEGANVGDTIRMEIGGGSSITVDALGAGLSAKRIDKIRTP